MPRLFFQHPNSIGPKGVEGESEQDIMRDVVARIIPCADRGDFATDCDGCLIQNLGLIAFPGQGDTNLINLSDPI